MPDEEEEEQIQKIETGSAKSGKSAVRFADENDSIDGNSEGSRSSGNGFGMIP